MRPVLFILLVWPLAGWAGDFAGNVAEKKSHPPHEEAGGLRLEVNAMLDDNIGSDGNTWKWDGASLTIEVALHNISEAPITVPTMAFDRQPVVVEWPAWGEGLERIMFSITSPQFHGKPAAYAPSRFAPVTLAPGEYAFLLRHYAIIRDRKHADSIKEASVHFGVYNSFVGPKDWWRGSLQTYGEIHRRKDPDKEIQEQMDYAKLRQSEDADPNFFKDVPSRVAAWIASADRVSFIGEMEKKSNATVLRDPEWIRRLSETLAKISVSDRVACMCSGWRTASFYKGDEMVVSVAAIHGNQLRIYWKNSGGDFPVDEAQWKSVSDALNAAYDASKTKNP